jgi:hypothetical protein
MFHRAVDYLIVHEWLHVPLKSMQEENPVIKLVSVIWYHRHTSFCCKDLYVTFWWCSFLFYVCFLFNKSVSPVKTIKYVRQDMAQSCYLRRVSCWSSFVCVTSQCIRMVKHCMWHYIPDSRIWSMHAKHYKTLHNTVQQILSHTQIF